ncbi:restriction endonuclease subunit S [Acinetobacter johnsonii]
MSVPKLRFKEFSESWSQVILDDLAEVERGKFSVRPRNDPRYFGGAMPFVQTGDVTGSDVYLKGFSQTLNEDGIKVSKVFPEDTILITIAANIGDTTITQYPVACPDSVVAIQPKKELANTIFLKNIIDLQKDFLDSQATQNAQKNINLQVLKPLELTVPSLKEQTKIASFLSAVDEKISQLTQKHELLSQYKQGMMQKLFNQQIRFKADDGSEFGEWEEKTIEQIANFRRGSFPQPYGLPQWLDNNGFPFVQVYDVSDKMLLKERTKIKISQLAADQSVFAKQGTLIITIQGSIGRIAKMQYDAYVDRTLLIFQSYNCEVDVDYFKYALFLLFNIEKERAEGAIIKTITKETLSKFLVQLPCLEEQTKIANFLSAIDQKIEVVAQQIEQAKQWKKGLLQHMFV